MSPGEVLARHTSRELAEWQEYARINPFGELRADMRAARICEVIAAVNYDKKSGYRRPTLQDFLLFRDGIAEPEREATQEEVRNFFRAIGGVQAAVARQGPRP